MKKKYYAVSDMVDIAIEKYSLDVTTDNQKKNYYATFSRELKKLNMWNDAKIEIHEKSRTRVFTEQQMQLLFSSKRIYECIRNNSTSKDINDWKSYNELLEESKLRREAYIDYMDRNMDNRSHDDEYQGCTQSEIRNIKIEMMIEALFNHYFTEFNEELLEHDLNSRLFADELSLTPDELRAEERLNHPYGNYYTLKEIEKEVKKEVKKDKA